MPEVGTVGSAGSALNVQNTQQEKNTGDLFSVLFSSMLDQSLGSIADFSNTDSDSSGSMFGGSGGLMGSGNMMETMLLMMLLSKAGSGNGINPDLVSGLLGMGTSQALYGTGSSLGGGYSSASLLGGSDTLVSNYLNQYKNASTLGVAPATSWVAANPAIVSHVGERNASTYRSVISQFNVETSERYRVNKMGDNDTYCNIFAWDVTRAMGAEIPHYTDASTGEPVQAGSVNAQEMDANAMNDWLNTTGKQYGWVQVSPEEAQQYANQGMPAVTSWKNPNGHGHMQVVSPSADGAYNAAKGVAIAQAGRHLYNYNYITSVYGAGSLQNVQYFAHI